MRLLLIALIIGLATTLVDLFAYGTDLPDPSTETPDTSDETPETTNETPDSSNETPDSTTDTPNSSTETPETPDTPETSVLTPDSAETPDTKGQIPSNHGIATAASGNSDDDDGSGSVFAKKGKSARSESKKVATIARKTSKPKAEQKKSQNGLKKQFLGYPGPDGRQSMAQGSFGQGGLPAPRYGGGMGNGGLGSEMEGMPVGIGGGGEPLGFREQEGQNFHVPGLSNGPANYDENAEVGRGDDDDNGYASRFSKQGDLDLLTQGALSRMSAPDQDSRENYEDNEREGENERSDALVTKAIGRPFEPENDQGNQMDNREDSPFQQVRQESPFQVPMDSLASQVSFANQQMSPVRPGYEGPLGQQQRETPSRELQPQGEEGGEEQGNGPQQEGSDFRATSMTGGAALMGMNDRDQEGMKRHELARKAKKMYRKTAKRKVVSVEKKRKSKKISAN